MWKIFLDSIFNPKFSSFRSVFIEASRVRKCGNVTSCNCGWSILNASVAQHVGSWTAASNYASPDINHRKYEGHWRNLSIDTLLPLRENSSTFLKKTHSTLKCQLVMRNALCDIQNPFSPDKYLSSIEYDFTYVIERRMTIFHEYKFNKKKKSFCNIFIFQAI